MAKRLLDFDPITRTKVWHDYDHSEDKTIIIEEQDCQPILDFNKRQYNDGYTRDHGMKNDMVKVGTIPMNVIMKWKNELGIDVFNKNHMPKVLKLLNDPEWRYLRTSSGKF